MTEDGRGKSEGSKKTQFRPGMSGNKPGRPKGAKGLRTELREELNELVEVTEGGRIRRLPKRRLVLKSLIAKAAKGDVRAAEKIVGLVIQFEGFEDERAVNKTLSAHDHAILSHFLNDADGRHSLMSGGLPESYGTDPSSDLSGDIARDGQ